MNKRLVLMGAALLCALLAIVIVLVMNSNVDVLVTQNSVASELRIGGQVHNRQIPDLTISSQKMGEQVNAPSEVGELIAVLRSDDLDDQERSDVLGKLYSLRQQMSDEELLVFWACLLSVAKERGLSAQFHSDELWVLNEIGLLLKHKGLLSAEEIGELVGFLAEISADERQELGVRRVAITVLGDLRVVGAVPMLSDFLQDKNVWNTPELARSATISLSRLDPEAALQPVSRVLSGTTNTAASELEYIPVLIRNSSFASPVFTVSFIMSQRIRCARALSGASVSFNLSQLDGIYLVRFLPDSSGNFCYKEYYS